MSVCDLRNYFCLKKKIRQSEVFWGIFEEIKIRHHLYYIFLSKIQPLILIQSVLSMAAVFASFKVLIQSCALSLSMVFFHYVSFDLPSGAHGMPILWFLSSDILKTWPNYFHPLYFTCSKGICCYWNQNINMLWIQIGSKKYVALNIWIESIQWIERLNRAGRLTYMFHGTGFFVEFCQQMLPYYIKNTRITDLDSKNSVEVELNFHRIRQKENH